MRSFAYGLLFAPALALAVASDCLEGEVFCPHTRQCYDENDLHLRAKFATGGAQVAPYTPELYCDGPYGECVDDTDLYCPFLCLCFDFECGGECDGLCLFSVCLDEETGLPQDENQRLVLPNLDPPFPIPEPGDGQPDICIPLPPGLPIPPEVILPFPLCDRGQAVELCGRLMKLDPPFPIPEPGDGQPDICIPLPPGLPIPSEVIDLLPFRVCERGQAVEVCPDGLVKVFGSCTAPEALTELYKVLMTPPWGTPGPPPLPSPCDDPEPGDCPSDLYCPFLCLCFDFEDCGGCEGLCLFGECYDLPDRPREQMLPQPQPVEYATTE